MKPFLSDREGLIAATLLTPSGRQRLAAAMSHPVRMESCPACGEKVLDLPAHCDAVGDELHLAASVMST